MAPRSTLWGELAWQLGGASGYAEIAESDKRRVPLVPERLQHYLGPMALA